jgi:hypothetical protein
MKRHNRTPTPEPEDSRPEQEGLGGYDTIFDQLADTPVVRLVITGDKSSQEPATPSVGDLDAPLESFDPELQAIIRDVGGEK